MANKILKENEILERIAKVRERLGETDSEESLKELALWEAKTKKALIFLNLKGHEGIDAMIEKAKEEIKIRRESLHVKRPSSLSLEASAHYASEAAFTFATIDLWTWFLNLFLESEADLKDVLDSLDREETPEEDEYLGSLK